MPRKLPWARASAAEAKPLFTSSPTTTPRARESPRADKGRLPQTKSRRSTPNSIDHVVQPGRTPSTSPPPQPIPERFIFEGRDADDKYRMVEDEFVAIAGQFTAHLHRAEYERLKNQARSQNAETIASIARPVVGSLTEIARKRQETVLRRRKQTEALKKARSVAGQDDLSGDEGDAPWRGTALHGLMESRIFDQVPLSRLIRPSAGPSASRNHGGRISTAALTSSSTRQGRQSLPGPTLPRTGVKRTREEDIETESDDSDDLDAGVSNRPPSFTTGAASNLPSLATPVTQQAARSSASAPQQKHAAFKLPSAAKSRCSSAALALSGNPPPGHPSEAAPTSLKVQAKPDVTTILSDSEDDLFGRILENRHKTRIPETLSTPTKVLEKAITSVTPRTAVTLHESSESETDLFADFMKSRRKNGRQPNRPAPQEEKKPERKKSLRELALLFH